jgi:hypothetical protein
VRASEAYFGGNPVLTRQDPLLDPASHTVHFEDVLGVRHALVPRETPSNAAFEVVSREMFDNRLKAIEMLCSIHGRQRMKVRRLFPNLHQDTFFMLHIDHQASEKAWATASAEDQDHWRRIEFPRIEVSTSRVVMTDTEVTGCVHARPVPFAQKTLYATLDASGSLYFAAIAANKRLLACYAPVVFDVVAFVFALEWKRTRYIRLAGGGYRKTRPQFGIDNRYTDFYVSIPDEIVRHICSFMRSRAPVPDANLFSLDYRHLWDKDRQGRGFTG